MNSSIEAPRTNARIDDYFRKNELPLIHPPGQRRSGFVFAEYVRDAKAFNVELLGGNTLEIFHFSQEVPGFTADFNKIELDRLYPEEAVEDLGMEGLRRELGQLPAYTTSADGTKEGDPLNLVIIGSRRTVLQSLIRSGWHLSETGNFPDWD